MSNDDKITITVSGKHGTGKTALCQVIANELRRVGIATRYEAPCEEHEYDLDEALRRLSRTARVHVHEQQLARDAVQSGEEMRVLAKSTLDGMKAEIDAWRRAAGLVGHTDSVLEKVTAMKHELAALRKWKREHKGAYAALMSESTSRPVTLRTGELTESDKRRIGDLREFASNNKCKQEVAWQDSLELARQHGAYSTPEAVPYKLDLPRYLHLLEMHFGAEFDKGAAPKWKLLAKTDMWDIKINDNDELLIRNKSFGQQPAVAAIPQAANALFVLPCTGVTMGPHDA